jgi:hypothetical protein
MLHYIEGSKIMTTGTIAMYVGNGLRDHMSIILVYNQLQDRYNQNRGRDRKSI